MRSFQSMNTNEQPTIRAVPGDVMTSAQKGILWILLIAGFLLRVMFLDRASYHIDEINMIQSAIQEKGLLTAYSTELDRFLFWHRLPLLVILIKAAITWFGSPEGFPSEWITRIPFALFGTLTLPLCFWIGRSLGGARLGLWAMLLVALSPFHIFYSREAYDYSTTMFFAMATIGCALEYWQRREHSGVRSWPMGLAYVVSAIGLLHSHLSGLLFLTTWSVIIGVAVLRRHSLKGLFDAKRGMVWIPVLAAPFFCFLPFVFKLLGGGWVNQENPLANTTPSLVALLGRMGWGESFWCVAPFTLFVFAGAWFGISSADRAHRNKVVWIVLQTLAYLALQSWLLRVSRFEVRYYSPLMPCLILVAALGLHAIWTMLQGRNLARTAVAYFAIAGTLLCGWLGYNAWLVMRLEARGANYKGVAKWITQNIPENGIYSYWNVYDARGVPVVYPTPGRYLSYPAAWSTAEDYRNMQIRERLTSFFTRFPTAYFVETAPADLVAPERANVQAISRSELFRNRIWLSDPVYQRMVQLKTLPLGEAQWESPVMDKYHISFNRPEDMPALAKQQGRTVFHYFGNDWAYVKDQQMNDWLATAQSARLFVGNIDARPQSIRVTMKGMSPPSGCRLNVYLQNGVKLLDSMQIPAGLTEFGFDIPNLAPGTIELTLDVLPNPNAMGAQFFAYSAEAQPIR